jgi:hypothetical protein
MNVRDVLYKCQSFLGHDPLPRGFLTDRGPARSESSWLTLRHGKHRPVRQTFLAALWQTPTGRIVRRGPVIRPARKAAVPPPAKADSRKNPHVHPSPQRKQGKCRWPHTTQRGSHVRSTRWWRGRLTRRPPPVRPRTRRVRPAWPRPHGSPPPRSARGRRRAVGDGTCARTAGCRPGP